MSPCFRQMSVIRRDDIDSTAYRGAAYNRHERRHNQLALIKRLLEKEEKRYQAQLVHTKKSNVLI